MCVEVAGLCFPHWQEMLPSFESPESLRSYCGLNTYCFSEDLSTVFLKKILRMS